MFFKKQRHHIVTDEEKISNVLERGVAEVIEKDKLQERMQKGKPLRVKLGIDPTSPHIHVGNAVAYLKLRDFQMLGHLPVIIIGDATGIVGDTSDKDAERPMLTRAELNRNKAHYLDQIGKLVDLSHAEVAHNSAWLDNLTYKEIGEQADTFSVADFIARDNIKRRLEKGARVSLRETLYPLMQGYDSVAVKADVELGGTDQRFNLLAGRTLQTHYGQQPQDIVMMNLIGGTDGEKMSKSRGNTINLTDTPDDMFGKVMRIPDELIETYFVHCTRVPLDEVVGIVGGVPREAKARLGQEIVKLYHSEEAAHEAEKEFTKVFSQRGVPSDVETVRVPRGAAYVDVIVAAGLVESKAQFRRLLAAGAICDAETGEKLSEEDTNVTSGVTLKIGKRRHLRIEVEE